jgi:membrane protease YdiL (CAAX protease family)
MNRTLTVRSAFGIVLFSVLSALIVSGLFSAPDSSTTADSVPALSTYLAMFIGQAFLIIPCLAYLNWKRLPLTTYLRLRPLPLNRLAGTIILSIGSIILIEEINILTGLVLPVPDESFLGWETMLNPSNPLSMAFLIGTIVILAPVGEEILFRGFLQTFLESAWRDVTKAVLFTSLFFAVIHFNPYWVVQIYLLGILLGYLTWRTGSILASIVFHILVNGTSLLLNHSVDRLEDLLLWHGHVTPLLLLLGGGLFYVGYKQLQPKGVVNP